MKKPPRQALLVFMILASAAISARGGDWGWTVYFIYLLLSDDAGL